MVTDGGQIGFGGPWVALGVALGLHVLDETLTGFLDVYNPTVVALREQAPWLPLPVFRFDVWLGGLIAAVALQLAFSRQAFRGAGWLRRVAWVLGAVMIANAVGHALGTIFHRTVASVRFEGPMPGVYSSPVLLAACVWLLWRLAATRHATGRSA